MSQKLPWKESQIFYTNFRLYSNFLKSEIIFLINYSQAVLKDIISHYFKFSSVKVRETVWSRSKGLWVEAQPHNTALQSVYLISVLLINLTNTDNAFIFLILPFCFRRFLMCFLLYERLPDRGSIWCFSANFSSVQGNSGSQGSFSHQIKISSFWNGPPIFQIFKAQSFNSRFLAYVKIFEHLKPSWKKYFIHFLKGFSLRKLRLIWILFFVFIWQLSLLAINTKKVELWLIGRQLFVNELIYSNTQWCWLYDHSSLWRLCCLTITWLYLKIVD